MDSTTIKTETAGALYAQPDITIRGSFSKSHLYNLIARGLFPKPALKCGPRFTRWSAVEVNAWFSNPQAWIDARAKAQEATNV